MGQSALKRVPIEIRPEVRVGPQPIPENWPRLPAANTNVEVIEGFVQKYLRVGGKLLGHALFYAQFLELEGDNPHHTPIIDRPPDHKGVGQWIVEIEEFGKIAAEIATLQQQIRLMDEWGLGNATHDAKDRLEHLVAQVQTIAHGIGAPITSGALKMVASAETGAITDANTIASDSWQTTARERPGLEVLQRVRDRLDVLKAEIVAKIDAGQDTDEINAWFTQAVEVELRDMGKALNLANLEGNRDAGLIRHNAGQHIHSLLLAVEEALYIGSTEYLYPVCLTPSHNLELVAQWLHATFGSRAHIETFGMMGATLSLNIRDTAFREVLANLVDNAIRHGGNSNPRVLVMLLNDRLIVGNIHQNPTAKAMARLLNAGHRVHEGQHLPIDDSSLHGLGFQFVQKWARQTGLHVSVDHFPPEALDASYFSVKVSGLHPYIDRTVDLQQIPWQRAALIPEPLLIPALVAYSNFSWRGRILQGLDSEKPIDDILNEIQAQLLPMYPKIREALSRHLLDNPELREDIEAVATELGHLVHTIPTMLRTSSRDAVREELTMIVPDSGTRALNLIGTALFYPSSQSLTFKGDRIGWSSHTFLTQTQPAFTFDRRIQGVDLDGTSILYFIQQVAPLITLPSDVEYARLHNLRHSDGHIIIWVKVMSEIPSGVEAYLTRVKNDPQLFQMGWRVVTEHQHIGPTDYGNLFFTRDADIKTSKTNSR